jgi:hypothetical protein
MDEHIAAPSGTETDLGSGGRLLLGWALIAASAVMLAGGWWGVSGQPVVAAQLAYLASGGLGGLLAGIVGVGLLVSHDLRKDRERLGRLESSLLEIRALLLSQGIDGGRPARGKTPTLQNTTK